MNDPRHEDCGVHDPCELGDPSCPRASARAEYLRNRSHAGAWSALETRREPGGFRHYLDGEPVHCGEGIELQAIEHDADDYGDFTRPVQHGAVVRYEAVILHGEPPRATLHTNVAGHAVTLLLTPSMRFRWPRRD